MKKLRTFVTHSGFFEKAVAAASMKAARELLDLSPQAFKRQAIETADKTIIEAALRSVGKVVQRPMGTKKPFKLHPDEPNLEDLLGHGKKKNVISTKASHRTQKGRKKADKDLRRMAALARTREKEEKLKARREKERLRQLQDAEARHRAVMTRLNTDRERIRQKIEQEERRWVEKQKRLTGD